MSTMYLIQVEYGPKIGRDWITVETSRAITLQDLARGEWDNPIRVLEVIPDEGTARDVSEDFAHDIAALREPLSSGVMDFIEQHAGTRIVHEMEAA